MSEFEATPLRGLASGDQYSDAIDQSAPDEPSAGFSGHPMDSPAMRKEHRRLLEWWYFEREKQTENRFQQSIDADYYDNLQWDPDDAEIVRSRGQMPLVYNEVAPMCDWLIGTERRGELPKTHRQCSLSPSEPIPDNHLQCCLGVKCAACPQLLALDQMERVTPEEIDTAKAWTCAAHIVSEGGDRMNEGYILTVCDRMFWDRVYENLCAE